MLHTYKTALKYTWIGLLILTLVLYFVFPSWFTIAAFKAVCNENQSLVLLMYCALVLLRSIIFIPSTAVLILGLALYPNDLWFLLVINMIGIVLGSLFLYAAGKIFTPDHFFSKKTARRFPAIKEKINQHGFWIVLGWSFFPVVPTDLICFVAGATRMKVVTFLTAMFLGELVLVCIYLFTGKGIMDWIF